MIDEEGCEAAAYVDIGVTGAAAPPPDEIDFTLDRPFLFAVAKREILFAGIVNRAGS